MKPLEEVEYSIFTQKFIEVKDELQGYINEFAELTELEEEIPNGLMEQLNRYTEQYQTMAEKGKRIWGKDEFEMYEDGWAFWMKEDAELREKRYGNKG